MKHNFPVGTVLTDTTSLGGYDYEVIAREEFNKAFPYLWTVDCVPVRSLANSALSYLTPSDFAHVTVKSAPEPDLPEFTADLPVGTRIEVEYDDDLDDPDVYEVVEYDGSDYMHKSGKALEDKYTVVYVKLINDDETLMWLDERDFENATKVTITKPDPSVTQLAHDGFNTDVADIAQQYGKPLTFRYAKNNGAIIETRKLIPDRIYEDRAGDWLMVGIDPERDAVRAYRFDRIVGEVSL